MNSIEIQGANVSLQVNKEGDQIHLLCEPEPPKFPPPGGHRLCHSAWKPSPEELELLKQGHAVQLTVYGEFHPLVEVGVTEESYP